MGYRP